MADGKRSMQSIFPDSHFNSFEALGAHFHPSRSLGFCLRADALCPLAFLFTLSSRDRIAVVGLSGGKSWNIKKALRSGHGEAF
jgi:hypothetical protein